MWSCYALNVSCILKQRQCQTPLTSKTGNGRLYFNFCWFRKYNQHMNKYLNCATLCKLLILHVSNVITIKLLGWVSQEVYRRKRTSHSSCWWSWNREIKEGYKTGQPGSIYGRSKANRKGKAHWRRRFVVLRFWTKCSEEWIGCCATCKLSRILA